MSKKNRQKARKNIPVAPDLHEKLKFIALSKGTTLSNLVNAALTKAFNLTTQNNIPA